MLPKVAIIYLSFHCEPYMDDVVSALKKMSYPKDRVELVIVDNPHPKHGNSVRFIEETVLPLSGTELPHITLLAQETNLGFSGGNNVGLAWVIEHGFKYAYFHNNDGFVASDFLEPLVETMEKDETVGAIQSLLMLYPESDLVNSSGNSLHYLAIGYCNNFRVPLDSLKLPELSSTNYASGAAMIMRTDLLQKFGLWDHDFFLYHEDIEYSLRLKAAGYKVLTSSRSKFYHKYSFGRNAEKFYYIERNRWGVMLMFYTWKTLLLLLPMAIILEVGLVLFSIKGGWFHAKARACFYWLKPSTWRLWLGKRKKIQALRVVSDRELTQDLVSKVAFNEATITNPLLTYVGNPLMALYWAVVKHLL